jgi:hypothetical protein
MKKFIILLEIIILLFLLLPNFIFAKDSIKTISEIQFESINKVVRVSADSSTYDNNLGDSYRLLQVFSFSNNNLELIRQIILPVNLSPDFPYKLILKFDGHRKFAVIKGNRIFYIYDVLADSLSEPIKPGLTIEEAVDAQTGMLINLKLSADGNTLSGEAMDMGAFSFDLSNPLKPKQLSPIE